MDHNRALKILFLSNGIFCFASSFLGPLYAVYVQNFDNSVFVISTTWAVFLVSTTLFTWIISRIGDRFAKDHLLVAGFLIRGISWLLFVFTQNLAFLIGVQILLGLGEAVGTPAFDAIFAEHLNKNEHVREYSDWKVILNLVTAVGTILGGLIVTKIGFHWLFIFMSIMALLSMLVFQFKPRQVHLE